MTAGWIRPPATLRRDGPVLVSGSEASRTGAALLPGEPYLLRAELDGPATFVVTTTADHTDDGCDTADCTLREAINAAYAGTAEGTIRFASGVAGFIDLASALPVLSRNLTIIGPGADVLTVRRRFGGNHRIFTISNGTGTGPVVTVRALTLNNGLVTVNTIPGSTSAGGCVYNDRATLRIIKCAITNNGADTGSGIYNFSGTVEVSDSTVSGNAGASGSGGSMPWGGGAFVNYAAQGPASLTLSNITLTGNQGDRGSVIHNSGATGSATVSLQNCTVAFNGGTQGGGNIFNDGSAARVEVRNTILRGAGAFVPTIVNMNGATVMSQGNNLSSDAVGGDSSTAPGGWLNQAGDIRNTDPRLAQLAANGGPTQTLALLADSPAINAGNDTFAPPRDQRGYVRPDRSDIGAFEFGGTIAVTLANLSTRLRSERGDNVLIGGFIISGSQPKKLMIRGIGPSLPLQERLANPVLELFNSSGEIIAANDNWNDAPNRQEILDSSIAPSHELESAILVTLQPDAYTARVRGVDDATGVALAELYDLDRTSASKLANISTRGRVQTGDDVMIGGFIVVGADSERVVIRAIGPSLPMSGALQDPLLELYDANGTLLRTNDNWRDEQEAEITATGIPPRHDAESAIVATLFPAAYTAVVRGKSNTTGVALVEVYAAN
jgi:CSLREA domain-containing protein